MPVSLWNEAKGGERKMDSKSLLTGRVILVVDNDGDVLDTMAEQLDMCLVHKASDYDSAIQYLLGHTYDFVILGMEGRALSDLLETCVLRGFATVVLVPPPVSPESVKIYTSLEFIHFHPKEKIAEIKELLASILTELNKPRWRKLLERVDAEFFSHITPHQGNRMI